MNGAQVSVTARPTAVSVGAVSVGIDLGQRSDPTALVVCEELRPPAGGPSEWAARDLARLPLLTPYPDVAARVALVVGALRSRGVARVRVIADATGVGIPVVELIREALKPHGVGVIAATFTHGRTLNKHGAQTWTVGKAFLVGRLQALLQDRRIRLPPGRETAALASELEHYEIRLSDDAKDTYGAFKVGTHDDLVTALGLATLEDTPPGGTGYNPLGVLAGVSYASAPPRPHRAW